MTKRYFHTSNEYKLVHVSFVWITCACDNVPSSSTKNWCRELTNFGMSVINGVNRSFFVKKSLAEHGMRLWVEAEFVSWSWVLTLTWTGGTAPAGRRWEAPVSTTSSLSSVSTWNAQPLKRWNPLSKLEQLEAHWILYQKSHAQDIRCAFSFVVQKVPRQRSAVQWSLQKRELRQSSCKVL